MPTSKGNCYDCGKQFSKTGIAKHLLTSHNDGDEKCYLLKAEGVYSKKYWLYFTAPKDAALSDVDVFLRRIWLECCGHMSGFSVATRGRSMYGMRRADAKVGKSRKLEEIGVGLTLEYQYDYGSTTRLAVSIVGKIMRPAQSPQVRLLARNEAPSFACEVCGKPADYAHTYEDKYLCEEHFDRNDEDEVCEYLPITNSPRSGVCAYEGEDDIWTFLPSVVGKVIDYGKSSYYGDDDEDEDEDFF